MTVATGGAIAPLFVALGVTCGAIQIGTSIVKANNATTDDEAKSAWLGMGAGTSAVGMSVLGSKAALKGAGVDTKGMGFLKATLECFRQVPSSVSKSVGAFTSGQALTNIKNVFKPKKTANTEPNSEPKSETNSEPKTETQTENNTKAKTETKAKAQQEPEVKQNVEPKSETKAEPQTEQTKAPEVKETSCEAKTKLKPETSEATAESKPETLEVKPESKKQPETQAKQANTTEPKANIKTAHQTLDEAKAKFFETHRKDIPQSFEERYNKLINEIGKPKNSFERRMFEKWASEDGYLDYMWQESGEYKQLRLAAILEDFSEEQMTLFNQAKDVLNAKGVQYDLRELAELPESILREIAQGRFSNDSFVYCHRSANNLNPRLRQGSENAGIEQLILDEGFKQVKPTTKSETVYREVASSSRNKLHYDFMKKLLSLKEGKTFTDSGYAYASYDASEAVACSGSEFGGDILRAKLVINVPEGARVSQMRLSAQSECLFPRNAKFKVLTPYNPETGEIFVEYILPN